MKCREVSVGPDNKACGLRLDREASLVGLQELRSQEGARRVIGTISRGLVGGAAAAHGTGLTCQGWAPVVRGLRWATAHPVLSCMPVADRLLFYPKLCKLALLANKTLQGTAFKKPG